MRKPLISTSRISRSKHRQNEGGVTIILVALAMVAIMGMAVLSIDLVTLYLAKEEAQRSADEAALAAARILSISGITGDPGNSSSNWGSICGPNGVATQAAQAVVAQNTVAGLAPGTVTVNYAAGTNGTVGAGTTDCTSLSSSAFGVNPLVTVTLSRPNLPSFFSRFWGNPGQTVTATATAEAFNASDSGAVGNQTTGTITPVQPWCVKPWVVPNRNPLHSPNCTTNCDPFVDPSTGAILHQGISLNGGGSSNGVIGETFSLAPDCRHNPNTCTKRATPPAANYIGSGYVAATPNLLFLPGQVTTQPSAVPSCTTGDAYNEAIVGCDQNTNYSCGVPSAQAAVPNAVDLTTNPWQPIRNAAQCLIHQNDTSAALPPSGQDQFDTPGYPTAFPFQIHAGSSNVLGIAAGSVISTSPSVVSLPICDGSCDSVPDNAVTQVTFIGFLQVFINGFDNNGNLSVTVLNVVGCGNGSNGTPANPVVGTSPVPVRLVTPP